jgi:four helix bundle protein
MSNYKAQMPNKAQNPNDKKKYDLEERTAQFGEAIIDLAKTLPQDSINSPLISQIVRAATSVEANYMEADGAESKKDFQHRISICKKEAKETKHWLRMIAKANPSRRDECQKLLREAQELSLIFSSILLPRKK